MARPEGIEPPTTWFDAKYSIQLSYGRAACLPTILWHPLRAQGLLGRSGGLPLAGPAFGNEVLYPRIRRGLPGAA